MPAPKRPTVAKLQKQCDKWNAAHPEGTTVSYESIIGEGETHRGKSRSEAQVVGGHSAVIWLEGYSGWVCLDHCTAVAAEVAAVAAAVAAAEVAGAVPVMKVTFGDYGQDFSEWYVRDGVVIDCQPHQGRTWVGTKVTNQATLCKGGLVAIISKAGGEAMPIKYPIAKVRMLSEFDAEQVVGYARLWADTIPLPLSALGL